MDSTGTPEAARGAAAGAARGRRARRWLAAAGSALAGLLLAELGLRWLLFGESALAARLGGHLRQASFYSDPGAEGDYWRLHRRWISDAERDTFVVRDERLGWLDPTIAPRTYDHVDRARLDGRRPVLLFGDSFAACVLPDEVCWQALLERSPLGEEYCLINYGVPSYGLDQSYLLMERALERWEGQDPVVVLSLLVDDDVDRCLLDFRGCAKPTLALEEGELVPTFPGAAPIDAWLDEHPARIRSYVWRLVSREWSFLPSWLRAPRGDEPELVARKRALGAAILRAAHRELEARGVEHWFLLFHAPASARRDWPYGWREELVTDALEGCGARWVSSRAALRADHAATGREEERYFLRGDSFRGHLSAEGNEAVFPAIAAGLAGRFER